MELFKLLGTISIDNTDANRALDETGEKGKETQGKLSKAFSGVGKGALAVGKTVGKGLMVGGAAMGALTIKALNMSGDLEQNMGGSEQVFGKYAGKMQETARNAFSNMGLSTNDFLQTANKMGALFQGAGFTMEESMDLSSSAMQRAADVASIMGIDTSAAMEAIAGAAKGNFTMMDNLGVAMNDTTIQAYALSKGIDKSTSEMTNQEKIGLAMEMFMEKTAYAAGNYAKENETLAGSLGTAKAALTNFLDGSGDVDQLVTAFSNAADVIIDNLNTLAPRLITGITEIINKVVPMLPPLLQSLLPTIVEGAVSLINGLVAALPGILDALMGALPALIQGVQQIINALIQAMPQIIQSLVSALPALIPMLINGLVSMIVTLCTMIPQIIQPIINALPSIIISIVNALLQNLPALIQGLITLMLGIVAAIPQIIQTLVDALPQIIAMIITGLLNALPQIISGLVQVTFGIVKALPQIFASLVEGVINIFKGLWNGITNVFTGVGTFFSGLWNGIKNTCSGIWNATKETAGKIWNGIKDTVSGAVEKAKTAIVNGWNAAKDAAIKVWNVTKDAAKDAWGAAKDAAIKASQDGKNPIQAAWAGVKAAVGSVWDKMPNVIKKPVEAVKSWLTPAWNGIKNVAGNAWNAIKSAIQKPIEGARDLVKGAIDKIKGFFSFKISWPKIPMPHFGIKPSGWKIGDLLKGSIPRLGIEWYAKGGIMNRPTLFDYDPVTGTAKVGGEAGAEAVAPIDTLQQYIRAAVQNENAMVAQKLDRIITLLVQFFPDALEAMQTPMVLDPNGAAVAMAPAMNAELGKIAIQKGRGKR